MLKNWIMRLVYQRKPRARDVRLAASVLTELGIDSDYLVKSIGRDLRERLNLDRTVAQERIGELLRYNNEQVERRRKVEQSMRGMMAYVREYSPELTPAFSAILQSNGITL